MGDGRVSKFQRRELKERDHLEDLGVNGRMILKCILTTWFGVAWTGLF
jgi:hypothetical protein